MQRLMNLQFAGDYRDAYRRAAAGQSETYHGHRYILDGMSSLGRDVGEVALYCCLTQSVYDETPEPGLRVMGGGMPVFDSVKAIEAIEAYAPSHLVLHLPDRSLINWAASSGIKTMVMLADSFNGKSVRERLRYFLLTRALNRNRIDWVTNHGLKSCLSLRSIGVQQKKIIPWDYPYTVTPDTYAPRRLDERPETIELVYIGTISHSKGCSDAIRAVHDLKLRGIKAHLRLAGGGDLDGMRALAGELGVSSDVECVGSIPHDQVFDFLRSGHIALVVSRPDYPEGFPLTIYEALSSRTPLIVSDHPMFVGNLIDRDSALVFKAGNSNMLADKIAELASDARLYAGLSERSAQAWQSLQLPAKWVDVIGTWAKGGEAGRHWLQDHSLGSALYEKRLQALR